MENTKPICTGYVRQDGLKGIRNKLLIMHTVDCSAFVAQKIAENLKGMDKDVDVVGTRLCQHNQLMLDRLLGCCRHPNVGAVLVVGHGCEVMRADHICEFARSEGRKSEWMFVQERGGTVKSIEYGSTVGLRLLDEIDKVPRTAFYLSDLMVGGECGGSDATSGLAANPLVGSFFDRLISLGGTAIFEEPAEMLGLRDYLVQRGVNEQVKLEIGAFYDKIIEYSNKSHTFHIMPGNFLGGLTTIEEKSIGAVIKSGTAPISGVIKSAQRPSGNGLWILDRLQDYHMEIGTTVAGDAGALMEFVAIGCHLTFLTTGRGHVVGTPIAPTIKITGNYETYERMSDDIDIDASALLTGKCTMPELNAQLTQLVIDVCSGKPTKAEVLGHFEYEMLPGYQNNSV